MQRDQRGSCVLISIQDLSTIAFPVTFNEPLTLLQRAAEEVEYYEVLREAVTAADPIERLCFVAAFAVSGYAHTRHRSSRKGLSVPGLRVQKLGLNSLFAVILCLRKHLRTRV